MPAAVSEVSAVTEQRPHMKCHCHRYCYCCLAPPSSLLVKRNKTYMHCMCRSCKASRLRLFTLGLSLKLTHDLHDVPRTRESDLTNRVQGGHMVVHWKEPQRVCGGGLFCLLLCLFACLHYSTELSSL